MESFLKKLKKSYFAAFGRELSYRTELPLTDYSAMRCGGFAAACVFPVSLQELTFFYSHVIREKQAYFILGKGSNTLFMSGRHKKLFISTEKLTRVSFCGNAIDAEAGVPLSTLAYQAAERGLSGLSRLFGIPGSVGGAVFMNAGAYGVTVADSISSVDALFPSFPDTVTSIPVTELRFSYRKSRFSIENGGCIAGARFLLSESSRDVEKELLKSIMEKRQRFQPLTFPSLGSIFRRVGDISAGYYIEKAGLKGLSVGDAAISAKHAGFIINKGNARPEDVLALLEETKELVFRRLGVLLTPEIQIMR